MYKKAQAAMEFLMTYGWAILVVLIAIGALTYLVDFKSLIGNRCQLTAPLYCKSYKADVGSATLMIRNGLTDEITVTSIELVDEACTKAFTAGNTIAANGETTFVVDDVSCSGITAGKKVKTDVKIIYDETGGLTGITATGNLIVSVP